MGRLESTRLSSTVTVLEGSQELVLVQTDLNKDLTYLERTGFDGRLCQYVVTMQEGDTLYIPEGWSYMAKGKATTVWERKLLSPGIENYAAIPMKSETHQLNVNKLIKYFQNDDLLTGLWRRLTKAIKQINTAK